ncbi:MAG: hypothetical protein CSA54_00205 [Gammaproteobacteria bacterium]|nr:MAG: hypothetical protein CSA54_00205 [Gammaproteobacteria bacterium]
MTAQPRLRPASRMASWLSHRRRVSAIPHNCHPLGSPRQPRRAFITLRSALLLGLAASPLMAQEGALAPGSSSSADSLSSTDSISLDTMVVTGTRNERLLLDSPVRTEVVTRDMIERDNAHTVAEALESVPGLLLRDIHGKNGREVWLQGMSGDRVLVLVNGRPVSASTGSSIDVDQLSTFNVERIEIVKGAVSALYGNSAMGGVINVITKDDADEPGSISLDLGSYGDKSRHSNDPSVDRVRLTGGAGIHGDKTGARIDVDYIDTDGYDLDKSNYANEGAWGHRATINGRFDYEPSPSTNIAVDAGFYEESLDSGLGSFTPGIGVVRKLDTELARRESIGATRNGSHRTGATRSAPSAPGRDPVRPSRPSLTSVDHRRDRACSGYPADAEARRGQQRTRHHGNRRRGRAGRGRPVCAGRLVHRRALGTAARHPRTARQRFRLAQRAQDQCRIPPLPRRQMAAALDVRARCRLSGAEPQGTLLPVRPFRLRLQGDRQPRSGPRGIDQRAAGRRGRW